MTRLGSDRIEECCTSSKIPAYFSLHAATLTAKRPIGRALRARADGNRETPLQDVAHEKNLQVSDPKPGTDLDRALRVPHTLHNSADS